MTVTRSLRPRADVLRRGCVVIGDACWRFWQFAPGKALRFWMSGPVDIVARLWSWMLDGSLWEHLGATLTAMTLGYGIGDRGWVFRSGCCSASCRSCTACCRRTSRRFTRCRRSRWRHLFIIVFGIGIKSKVALVAITVFFLILNSTLDGVRNVDRDLTQALSLMGATRSEVIRKVLVPAALPWIFTGMRISVRYAFTNTLLAELISANKGIGFLIEYYSGIFDATGTYAAILVLVILSVGLTELLSRIELAMAKAHGRA